MSPKMKKIVTIVGARPQFVKAAVLSRAFAATSDIQEIIVHTGQHHDAALSDIFFEEMSIPKPHYNLEISGVSHGAMTGRMLEKIEEVLLKERPDWVMVYGDTNSTLAGALAASKIHIPIAHVEAGLRSFNMKMPEEVNRILTDRISTLLFCPTDSAVKNLKDEGISKGVVRTGDIMADALFYYQSKAVQFAKQYKTPPQYPFALATIHRAENTDDPQKLNAIFEGLGKLSSDLQIILPLHPRTKSRLSGIEIPKNITIIEPVGYFDMLQLLSACKLVVTDSGGLQKEAYLCKKPCVTLRNETEWVELVEIGVNKLAGTEASSIVQAAHNFLKASVSYKEGIYGNGDTASQIIKQLSFSNFL